MLPLKLYRTLLTVALILTQSFLFATNIRAQELSLNGKGIHSELQLDYYLAELYTTQTSSQADILLNDGGDQRMQLLVLVDDWSVRKFNQYWNQAIFINNSSEARSQHAQDNKIFSQLLQGNLKRGDLFTIEKEAGRGTSFNLNDVELYKTDSEKVFSLFLNTWIGARPPSSDFKASILGQTSTASTQLINDATLMYTDARRQKILNWRKPLTAEAKSATNNDETSSINTAHQTSAPATTDVSPATASIDPADKLTPAANTTKVNTPAATDKNKTDIAATDIQPATDIQTSTSGPLEAAKPLVSQLTQGSTEGDIPVQKDDVESSDVLLAVSATEAAPQQNQNDDSVVVAEAAPEPSVETVTAPEQPAQQNDNIFNIYRSNILALTYRNLIYPSSSIDRGHEGKIVLQLTLNRKGKLQNVDFETKSKYAALNKAALKAVELASPYPSVPRKVKGKEVVVELPITFALTE